MLNQIAIMADRTQKDIRTGPNQVCFRKLLFSNIGTWLTRYLLSLLSIIGLKPRIKQEEMWGQSDVQFSVLIKFRYVPPALKISLLSFMAKRWKNQGLFHHFIQTNTISFHHKFFIRIWGLRKYTSKWILNNSASHGYGWNIFTKVQIKWKLSY